MINLFRSARQLESKWRLFLRNIAVSYTTIKSLSLHEDDYLIFYRPIIDYCVSVSYKAENITDTFLAAFLNRFPLNVKKKLLLLY